MASALIPPRKPPLRDRAALLWVRRNLFHGAGGSAVTLVVAALLGWLAWIALSWGVLHAVWLPDADACQAARGRGACWGAIVEKHRLILFGRYPYDEQWRALAATLLLLGLLVASCVRRCWSRWLVVAWVLVLAAFFGLMRGGVFGLAPVDTDQWGGFPLTVMLATLALVLAFPLAILVALGRRSTLPAIRSLCAVYVELVRGVPLVSVLFMASFMFPLFLPPDMRPDVLIRVIAGLTLFSAAYLAEIVRAGLQSVPVGQVEAARSVGLGPWQVQRRVVLPQALAAVVPSLMNSFIGLFKDTSLITIVSLYELTGALGLAMNGDPVWRPYKVEGFLFITFIYFAACLAMSRYSLWVERRLAVGKAD